jgi:preprotein translocase subunit YajC
MNWLIPEAFAQGTGGSPGSSLAPLLMMVVFIVIFYFLLIRPQQKKAKEHQALVSKLAAGDEVVTAGGILGRIVEVGESFVTLEIADGVRIKVQ